MLTYSQLGGKGNLGNQLFQVASTVGLGRKLGHEVYFPKWKYSEFFDYELPELENKEGFKLVYEQQFCYHDWDLKSGDYDLNAWLQTEKYFDVEETRKMFSFKKKFLEEVTKEIQPLLNKKHILITVRRGDFVHHPNYHQLSYKYYFLAILHNFPDWKERIFLFTSDDIGYCKKHFGFLTNAHFLENYSAIEQLAICSQCKDFIISNSTFSWWCAWLGEKNDSTIIRPRQYLRGKFRKKRNDKDYFPERWIKFDHQRYSIPFKYYKLIFYGELYNYRINAKFYPKMWKKKMKKTISKVIRKLQITPSPS